MMSAKGGCASGANDEFTYYFLLNHRAIKSLFIINPANEE